ncbi:MAG: pyrimidine operon attenuation protein / uracil phosphoribosyltransferase [Azoarcus sp.]|uniref:Pyrimidine operon attenuation protein / uracil phosphoribosyltransferase n=1 Tax=Aromatoleum tolulyticum TaxID=34027 RepID=A0A1N6Z8M3_9RHOO|nr:bifunctional pyr operon transcriptional regulator/uracil phosphoribosyltransferase PyrR [Aromatoleum tolulyticum]MCK9987013.1 pyrimidine operon attenuation protein / uracil phosphoribosyltransferase [Azoarcus sp.]SIR23200.1 pyrimidine operon attenuation protein / uracil phosphoribosyltransferase [Aromatoleum tolulyticum]
MQKLDAEALFQTLVEQMRPHVTPDTALVGIHTGGVWLAERLHRTLGLKQPPGSIDVSFYRDDFASKGLHPQPKRTDIPFDVEGAHVIIVDDVLYTGRTTRAAINELFDFGRPSHVDLAVLVDRGGRELPIAARYCALTLPQPLPASQSLQLETDAAGTFTLRLIDA